MFENEGSTEEISESATTGSQDAGETAQAPEILDLEGVEKFKFGGREWTPKDFQGAYMMQADYTKKTQAIAQERKYYDNLSYDLKNVQQNPTLADKFKQIYPEKYHAYLDYVLASQPKSTGQPAQSSQGIDPQFYQEFQSLKQEMHERKVNAIEAELDSKFKVLSQKYPMADEESVLARAQVMHDRGEKLTDKVWESLWKSVNDKIKTSFEKTYSQKVKEQKTANSRGKDVAPGGDIPGRAPRIPKTIKEASRFALEELENS